MGVVGTNLVIGKNGNVTPMDYKIMTAVIDLTNSNPATCVSYEDDAKTMTAGSDGWDEFFGHYPVLFKNGREVGRLNRNDFTKFENGSPADITSGDSGDVMIAFPRRGLTIKTVDNKIYISMTNAPKAPSFEYNAHTRGEISKNVFYIGAYTGTVINSKLRSLANYTFTTSLNVDTFRNNAHANGSGYEMFGFYQLTFIQCMYILKYKNLDSQTVIGAGGQGTGAFNFTGETKQWGMDSEIIRQSTPSLLFNSVKLFGIENLYGNTQNWIDGAYSNNYEIFVGNDNFNSTGNGYTNIGTGDVSADINAAMSAPVGTTKAGFIGKVGEGSTSTYFCDKTIRQKDGMAVFGGHRNSSAYTGMFYVAIGVEPTEVNEYISARLMYL